MLVNQVIYDAATGETRIEQVEVIEPPQEPPIPPTLSNEDRIIKLEKSDIDLIATNWSMDDRIFEIEWFLEDLAMPKTNKFNVNRGSTMAGLSKFEQAKILILAGEYDRIPFEKQLRKYESRGLITKEELDILINMMDAKELIEGVQ